MRILHTADWHVGRTIRGRSRAAEHLAVLAEITAIARAEAVDLVLVAGDQFDTAAPSPEAERIVYRALLDLAEVAPVVVVGGNHDSAQRLEAVAPLLAASRVLVGATVLRPADGGVLRVDVASGESAQIALLPFVSQRGIVRAEQLMATGADEQSQRYDARLRALVGALTDGFAGDTVNLVLSHLMVAGGAMGGGERSAHTVFDYCLSATAFPATAAYVALGHLHRPQQVPGPSPAWYSGSPLQLDFGETADEKAVLVVQASPGLPASVRPVPLTAGRRLRTLRGTLEELEALAGEPGVEGTWLKVIVRGQTRAGLGEQVREWFPDVVDVAVESPEQPSAAAVIPSRLGRSPAELFGEYLAERGAVDERVQALFTELLEDLTEQRAGAASHPAAAG